MSFKSTKPGNGSAKTKVVVGMSGSYLYFYFALRLDLTKLLENKLATAPAFAEEPEEEDHTATSVDDKCEPSEHFLFGVYLPSIIYSANLSSRGTDDCQQESSE